MFGQGSPQGAPCHCDHPSGMPGRGCWPWERSWPEVSLKLKGSDLWWLWPSIPPHNDVCWVGCPGHIVFSFSGNSFCTFCDPFSTPATPAVGSISQDDQSGEGVSRGRSDLAFIIGLWLVQAWEVQPRQVYLHPSLPSGCYGEWPVGSRRWSRCWEKAENWRTIQEVH